LTNYEFHEIKNNLITVLENNELKIDELNGISKHAHDKKIKTVRILLDSEEISYNNKHNLILNQK